MKGLIVSALLFLSSAASANPFYVLEPFKTISAEAIFKIGTPNSNFMFGSGTGVLVHHSAAGEKIPGHSLWDIGWAKPTNGEGAFFVPYSASLELSDPIKKILFIAVDRLPDTSFQWLRWMVQPSGDAQTQPLTVATKLGGGWGLAATGGDPTKWQGSAIIKLGIQAAWK